MILIQKPTLVGLILQIRIDNTMPLLYRLTKTLDYLRDLMATMCMEVLQIIMVWRTRKIKSLSLVKSNTQSGKRWKLTLLTTNIINHQHRLQIFMIMCALYITIPTYLERILLEDSLANKEIQTPQLRLCFRNSSLT